MFAYSLYICLWNVLIGIERATLIATGSIYIETINVGQNHVVLRENRSNVWGSFQVGLHVYINWNGSNNGSTQCVIVMLSTVNTYFLYQIYLSCQS